MGHRMIWRAAVIGLTALNLVVAAAAGAARTLLVASDRAVAAAAAEVAPLGDRPGPGPGPATALAAADRPAVPTTVAGAETVSSARRPAEVAEAAGSGLTARGGGAARSAPATSGAQVAAPAVQIPAAAPVARRTPPPAEVSQALATLPRYVRSLLSPSPAQVAQIGDQVCTMLDAGQTVGEVKAAGLKLVSQVPLTTVLPGGADWVVATVVGLYCPGHLAKLG